MRRKSFIGLEYTTSPQTSEYFMPPIIENELGLKEGTDFWLAFSPDQVNQGNKLYRTWKTPKVLGAMSNECLNIGEAIYGYVVETIYSVSFSQVSVMVKILENNYRLINISLISELA